MGKINRGEDKAYEMDEQLSRKLEGICNDLESRKLFYAEFYGSAEQNGSSTLFVNKNDPGSSPPTLQEIIEASPYKEIYSDIKLTKEDLYDNAKIGSYNDMLNSVIKNDEVFKTTKLDGHTCLSEKHQKQFGDPGVSGYWNYFIRFLSETFVVNSFQYTPSTILNMPKDDQNSKFEADSVALLDVELPLHLWLHQYTKIWSQPGRLMKFFGYSDKDQNQGLFFTLARKYSESINSLSGGYFTAITPDVFKTKSWAEASFDAYKNEVYKQKLGWCFVLVFGVWFSMSARPQRYKKTVDGQEMMRKLIKQEFGIENSIRRTLHNQRGDAKKLKNLYQELEKTPAQKIDYNWFTNRKNKTLIDSVQQHKAAMLKILDNDQKQVNEIYLKYRQDAFDKFIAMLEKEEEEADEHRREQLEKAKADTKTPRGAQLRINKIEAEIARVEELRRKR